MILYACKLQNDVLSGYNIYPKGKSLEYISYMVGRISRWLMKRCRYFSLLKFQQEKL